MSKYNIPAQRKEKIAFLKAMMTGEKSIEDLKPHQVIVWHEDKASGKWKNKGRLVSESEFPKNATNVLVTYQSSGVPLHSRETDKLDYMKECGEITD